MKFVNSAVFAAVVLSGLSVFAGPIKTVEKTKESERIRLMFEPDCYLINNTLHSEARCGDSTFKALYRFQDVEVIAWYVSSYFDEVLVYSVDLQDVPAVEAYAQTHGEKFRTIDKSFVRDLKRSEAEVKKLLIEDFPMMSDVVQRHEERRRTMSGSHD